MPKNSKPKGGTTGPNQVTPPNQQRLGTKSSDFTFMTTQVEGTPILYRDPLKEDTPLHTTPVAGKGRASYSDPTKGENKTLIHAMWFFDCPISDPLASMKPLYRKLKAMIRTWDAKNPLYEWWQDYPDAVDVITSDDMKADPNYMTTEWLKAHRYELAEAVIHKIQDYATMRIYYEGSVYNIAQFIAYNGSEPVTRIASVFRQAALNKWVKNFKAFGVVPKGLDAYYLDFTRFAYGVNNRDVPILAWPLWRTWFTGNDWYHSIAYDEVSELDSSGKIKPSKPGVWLTQHLNATKHVFNVLSEYVYRDEKSETNYKSHFNGIKPHAPDVANLGRLFAQGGSISGETSTPGLKVASSATAEDGWTKPAKTGWKATDTDVESNLMSTLINNWKFFQMYLASVHPEFTQAGHDILKIADIFDLFEAPKDLPAITKLLGRNKNFELNDLLHKMEFDPNQPMNTTIINFAPFRKNRYSETVDVKCTTTDVSQHKMNVYDSNFHRYHLDDETRRAEANIADAAEWPHLNPSVFVDNEGNVHTSNAIPAFGSRCDAHRPIARSGSIKAIIDVMLSQPFNTEESQAYVYHNPERIKTVLGETESNIIYDEYPYTSWRMHLPLLSHSDPARSGLCLYVTKDVIVQNEWQKFYRDTSNYLSKDGKEDPDIVDSILGQNPEGISVIPNNLPAAPLWRSDLEQSVAGRYKGRKHVVNDQFIAGMGDVFIFTGLNLLFDPYDLFSSDRLGYIYASYDPDALSSSEVKQLRKDWESCVASDHTDEERNLMSSGLLRAARPDDIQDADDNSFFAVISAISKYETLGENADRELKLFVASPDYGPILWNVGVTRDDLLSNKAKLPILEAESLAWEDLEGIGVKERAKFHFARYDISADSGFSSGVNADVKLTPYSTYYDNTKGLEDPTWQDNLFNDILIKLVVMTSKPMVGMGRIPELTDKTYLFFFGDGTSYEDISAAMDLVSNIGGNAKLALTQNWLLPAMTPESFEVTPEIPENFVETPRFIPKVNTSGEGKKDMGRIRNKKKFTFSSPENSVTESKLPANSSEDAGFTGSNGNGNRDPEAEVNKDKKRSGNKKNSRRHTRNDQVNASEKMEGSGYDKSNLKQDATIIEEGKIPTNQQPAPENSANS